MKNFLGIALFFISLLLWSANTFAQQWSDEQKAVWAGVESYWQAGMSDDPSGLLSYFDDSYFGWNYSNDAPGSKSQVTKVMNYWFKKGKTQYYNLTPARIWVNGDFAYVHYYYVQVTEDNEGKPNTERGRWTDVLMKKGDKWMLVGDHGGEIDDD